MKYEELIDNFLFRRKSPKEEILFLMNGNKLFCCI